MVTRDDDVIHFFPGPSRSLLESTLNDVTFSKCTDIYTLHVCKLC